MKEQRNLTRKILEFFQNKPGAPLDNLLTEYKDRAASVYGIVHRLEQQGYLAKTKERVDRRLKSFFELTPKARAKLDKNLKKAIQASKSKWDGVWRLIIFDVPEQEKAVREYLRHELKDRGFYMLQLSVWITPHEVDKDLEDLIEKIGAKYYVRYMVVKEINYESDVLRHFGL